MRAFTVKWNPEIDNTTIEYSTEFVDSDWIVKADVLKDALYDLEEMYKKVLEEKK